MDNNDDYNKSAGEITPNNSLWIHPKTVKTWEAVAEEVLNTQKQ